MALIPLFDIAEGTVKADPVHTQVAKIDKIDPPFSSSIHLLPTEWVT